MPPRLSIKLCPEGSCAPENGEGRALKLLIEIIEICETDPFSAGHRRSLVGPLAFAWAYHLSARRLNRIGSDPGQFAEQRTGIQFR